MAIKQDARPFIDLQKDAEEFRAKFEEDIEKCKSILNAKITDLICDPDSLGNSQGIKQNALVEFSKAKYDIYISMKSLMNEMEREWLKYISEMKKLFIDNVEVFLANTKLEVKLPPTESLLSHVGPRKSFGSKSTDVTSSIFPLISNITKSIPGFTQKNKSYDLEMERKEVDMASVYDSLKHKKNPSPLKQSSFCASSNITDLSENDDEEINESQQYVSEVSSRYSRRGRFTDQRTKASGISAKKASSSESQETSDFESESTCANSRKLNRSTSRSRTAAISEERINSSDESEEPMETESNNKYVSSKASKRKQASKTQTNTKIREEKYIEPEREDLNGVSGVISETGRGKSAPAKNGKNVSVSRRGRPSRRPVVNQTVIEEDEEPPAPQPPRSISRRKTLLPTAKEVELDEEPSAPQPSRSVSRRKTLLPTAKEATSGSDIIPGNRASGRSKRKTIIGVSDFATEAPAKRLKGSNIQKTVTAEEDEDVAIDVNLLENGSYSDWISLKSIDGKIPTSPGIYEVKVWRAKKSAYIGFCDSLRQKMTIHKLKQNSGHKHLDKFIERNYEDIQIRYEVVSSVNDAKVEVKNRINSFVAQHKTTPAYN